MNMGGLIQCLIVLVVVSMTIAGVYAAEAGATSHVDSIEWKRIAYKRIR